MTSEGHFISDTYKDIVKNFSLIAHFKEIDMEKMARWLTLRNIISSEYLDIRWSSIRRFIGEAQHLFNEFLERSKNYLRENPEE